MHSILFPNRKRNLLAALVSLLALGALALYAEVPSSAIGASLTASYKQSSRTLVQGVVKLPNGRPDRRGRVVLVFRNKRTGMIKRLTVRVNRRGQFLVLAPRNASSVVLTVYLRPGHKAPHGTMTFALVSGKALTLMVVFHDGGGGILPAVFPY